MSTQKDIVFSIVIGIIGKSYKEGTKVVMTKEQKAKAVTMLEEAHAKGDMTIENKQESIHSYCVGLLNNHLRKDKRLNGGEVYKPANPGSRTGIANPAIKATRQLANSLPEGSAEKAQVVAELDKMIATDKAQRAASKATASIDVDSLPENLKGFVNLAKKSA